LVDEASARMTPVLERVGPAVDTARTKLRDDVVPAVAAAVENSGPARAEAKERAAAAVLALRGQQRKRVRRWPVALLCLLAGGAAGLAASKLTKKTSSTVTPTPFPTAAPKATEPDETSADTKAPYPVSGPTVQ
jgi:hypothetical protein